MRGFKKVIDSELKKENIVDVKIPKRSTKMSAGYDFYSPVEVTIKKGKTVTIPTGIKAYMKENEFLMLVIRSSMGFKYNIRMTNQVGIIDSDYYENKKNDGHIYISLQNHGEEDFKINKNDRICQGIFQNYLTIEKESQTQNIRFGGIGSTNRR